MKQASAMQTPDMSGQKHHHQIEVSAQVGVLKTGEIAAWIGTVNPHLFVERRADCSKLLEKVKRFATRHGGHDRSCVSGSGENLLGGNGS